MKVKSIKPINFLFFRTETKVSELWQFIPVGQDLYKEAVDHQLQIMGPIQWHYFGFSGDESKTFTLEVSLPVGDVEEAYDGKFHFKRTDPFKCISEIHEGGWLEIPKTYGKIFQFMQEQNLAPISVNREIYIQSDLKDPEANTTEILVGIN
jgi:effector-binding domain-containing protein